jgi:arylsulfatase
VGATPHKVAGPVMLIDVAPTILDLIGAAIPTAFRGSSLMPAVLGETIPADRRVYAELLPAHAWMHSAKSMVEGDYKVLYKISENAYELYDLKNDPTEQRNLWTAQPAKAAEMKRKLLEWMESELTGS